MSQSPNERMPSLENVKESVQYILCVEYINMYPHVASMQLHT